MLSRCYPRFTLVTLFMLSAATAFNQSSRTLFQLLPSSQTGINFTNTIFESDTLNILNQANVYNGGGIGVGDFNNDGLADIYFAGNMVSNKLYLNKGSFKFDDITKAAGVAGEGRWCTGVSVVDINADGLQDIYVSASFYKDALRRRNLLYINQGNNKEGIPSFKESATAYGIADSGYSTQGVFFDYDKDGDLDLYIVTNALNDPKTPIKFRPKVTDGTAINNDRLYRNNHITLSPKKINNPPSFSEGESAQRADEGEGGVTFTNVSKEAGISIEGWGHAASISDFNLDGWPDIYVANDFISNDLLYINNKNGTFTNRLGEYFKHTGWNAMGTDVVDINNDGFADVVSLEMLPEDNLRKKRMLGGNEYFNYFNSQKFGYEHQYVRNVLQINTGNTPAGHPMFSEVGFMAGIYQTDWSWCPLVADFDNDGFRDMIITNGLPRDVTDLDYIVYNSGQGGGAASLTLAMTEALPVVKLADYAFKNNGGLLFENTTTAWGLTKPAFSNGGVYVDLDNDHDLDLAVNNINEQSFIYENTLNNKSEKNKQHSLQVILGGSGNNTQGIGATLRIYYAGNKQQYYEHQPCRGYLSTVDARAYFGLGNAENIDSIRVQWPDGKGQLLTNIKADSIIKISHKDALESINIEQQNTELPIFKTAASEHGIKYRHKEQDAIDYNLQPAIPHKLSQYGPGIAVGDIDNNGYDDFYIGGSAGNKGVFFMQDSTGNFLMDEESFINENSHPEEDMGALLFDADNDADLDLYVVSGSYEFPPNNIATSDRLYVNDGKGKFEKSYSMLPIESSNGSCVRAADFDRDGDLDLFVGGRVVSGAYPSAPRSFILKNEAGTFVNVTRQYCPDLQNLGMITDALWSDFDQDGLVDLVLTGEWMPVTFYKNTGEAFVSVNNSTGISQYTGWWNSLVSGDFDNDGDIDYAAGNLGLNSNFKATPAEPMTIYAKDLDDNGLLDPMLFCYMRAEDGTRKPFPMHTRDDMISQMISIRKKYPTYKAFGQASMDDLWSKQDRENAMMYIANFMSSAYIENKGNGKFIMKPLPLEAQVAPVYGMVSEDVDDDGNTDLLLVGNDFGMEPYSGRHDAFMGLYMKGDGKGNFTSLPISKSGFFVKGDAKCLATIQNAEGGNLLVVTQNQDSVLAFSKNVNVGDQTKWIKLNPNDFFADIISKNNEKRRVEFYYGSTYLSQSSRFLKIDKDAVKIVITDFSGNKKEVNK